MRNHTSLRKIISFVILLKVSCFGNAFAQKKADSLKRKDCFEIILNQIYSIDLPIDSTAYAKCESANLTLKEVSLSKKITNKEQYLIENYIEATNQLLYISKVRFNEGGFYPHNSDAEFKYLEGYRQTRSLLLKKIKRKVLKHNKNYPLPITN